MDIRPTSFVVDPALKVFDGTFNGLVNGVLFVDENGEIILANDTALEYLGYLAQDLSNALIFTVNPHLTLLSWKKIWKSLKSGDLIVEDTEFMHAEGGLMPVQVSTRLQEANGHNWAMISIEFLLASKRFFDLLSATTDTAKICSWELDLINKELLLFGDVSSLLGLPNEQYMFEVSRVRKTFEDHLSENDFKKLQEVAKALIEEKVEFFEEVVIFNRSEKDFDRLQINGRAFRRESYTCKIYGTIRISLDSGENTGDHYLSNFTLDHLSEFVFWVKKDASIAYANRAVCERLGYTRKEILKLTSHEIIRGLDKQAREVFWKKLRKEKHIEGRFELITQSGKTVPILASNNYLVYEGEEYNCAFARDVTAQERETDQLKLTQFSIENSHEMIVWIQLDGSIYYANSAFNEKTGYDKEEVQELNVMDLINDDEFWAYQENNWTKLKELKEFDLETTLSLKEQKPLHVYCTFNLLEYKDKEFICVHIRDWSKKKKRDRQLFLSQNALDSAQDMIFWIDQNQKITYKNEAVLEKLGYKRGELKGKDLKKIYPEIDLKEVLAKDGHDQFESKAHTKTGKIIPVEVSLSPAKFKGDKFHCLIVRDISEHKQSQQKLEKSKNKIEELSLKLKDENILLREEIYSNYNFNNIITQDENYRNVLGQIAQVADSNATVLIQGETGTGKELLARAIYSLSDREDRPFIKVNCAALPENLIESELFGHEKGAFTGAIQQKKGRFELADKGTIFLDEIGELPLDLQAKLLRVLQEGEFERLGGTTTLQVDVRIVAATNRNLEEMVEKGTFREDLFYRLNVFPIENPPLRDRKGDIPLLIKHFTRKYGKRMGKKISKISQGDITELQKYSFPGNIRELENMVERAMILAKDGVLNLKASFDLVRGSHMKGKEKKDFLSFEEMQREHIIEALKKCNMRITGPKGAARLLQLNDRTLMSKMRKLDIKREDYI